MTIVNVKAVNYPIHRLDLEQANLNMEGKFGYSLVSCKKDNGSSHRDTVGIMFDGMMIYELAGVYAAVRESERKPLLEGLKQVFLREFWLNEAHRQKQSADPMRARWRRNSTAPVLDTPTVSPQFQFSELMRDVLSWAFWMNDMRSVLPNLKQNGFSFKVPAECMVWDSQQILNFSGSQVIVRYVEEEGQPDYVEHTITLKKGGLGEREYREATKLVLESKLTPTDNVMLVGEIAQRHVADINAWWTAGNRY